ncbi:chaperonin GroEL [Methylobacterium planeticum]|uniref:Chaperonin GroEL n=1 Tax=Methylobacterium planeticum TaxID=2615211 RepID=A0A6N6MNQ9_9HYPH|nr:chaperonin GroEL [Methylobacterium planeticum]KAB1072981.1 chaperonin GroEL [Methylobacterium planeticum]
MAAKQVTFSDEARSRMLRGIDILSETVRVTLGPRGRIVVLGRDHDPPRITKDGVTVANDIELDDRFANMGVQMVKAVASRASYLAGDGTTTATVLAQAVVREGVKLVAAGVNPMDLKRGIDAAVAAVVADLRRNARPVTSSEEIAQIATVSGNGDATIGRLLADAMRQVGNDGVISVEAGDAFETVLDVTEGMRFDRGYISSTFVTDPRTMRVELDQPYVLVSEKTISSLRELLPLLDAVMETGRPLFIVAEGVEGEAFATLAVNTMRGSLKVAAVKAPGYGPPGKALLQDIAIFTGGHAICEELGIKLENASIRLLGQARRVTVDRNDTTIVGGYGKDAEIEARIRELKAQIDETTSDYDREKLQERIGRLSTGVAVIRVGGASEAEVRERKDRIDNALHATRAAAAEGILPGGGVALLRAARALGTLASANEDQRQGVRLVAKALAAPVAQIASNAGQDSSVVIGRILANDAYGFGYDAQTGTYADLLAAGIVDPAEVVCTALRAAASVAGLLVTTEVMIADLHDRVVPELDGHHHHGNMDIDF